MLTGHEQDLDESDKFSPPRVLERKFMREVRSMMENLDILALFTPTSALLRFCNVQLMQLLARAPPSLCKSCCQAASVLLLDASRSIQHHVVRFSRVVFKNYLQSPRVRRIARTHGGFEPSSPE